VDIARPVEGKAKQTNGGFVFSIGFRSILWGIGCITYTVSTGIGTWGLNKKPDWNGHGIIY